MYLQLLRRHRNFRLLFIGQLISFLGSMISYVAVPVQVQALTHSPTMVGLLGATQLVPVLLFGLWGGALADSLDRRRLLLWSEAFMGLGTLGLGLNAFRTSPSIALIFVLSFLLQSANALHRPAMEALSQKLVDPDELPAAAALTSLRSTLGAVLGPMLGGLLVAGGGPELAYAVDALTYGVAVLAIALMHNLPAHEPEADAPWTLIQEGLAYARSRPELLGTYAIDIVAMTFAFPVALFPALSEGWGGSGSVGYLYAAMPLGAFLVSLPAGRAGVIRRQGAAVCLAAAAWGLFIAGFGAAGTLPGALFFLVLAGAADAVSGIYRMTIWNQTIPNQLRGRLAGVEMISYLTGPLLGNARVGAVASATSNTFSVVSGGLICCVGVLIAAALLPAFWAYRAPAVSSLSRG